MTLKKIIIYYLAIVMTPPLFAQDEINTIDSILLAASEQLQNRDFNSAFYSFNEATKALYQLDDDDPIRPKAYYECGKAFELIAAHKAAIDYYHKAMSTLNTNYPGYHFWKYHLIGAIGSASMNLGDYETANEYFEKGIAFTKSHNPTVYQAAAYNNMGILHQKTDKETEAISTFLHAIEMIDTIDNYDANDLRFALKDNLAQSYISMGSFNLAESILLGTINDVNPKINRNYNAYIKLVTVYLSLNKIEAARSCLSKAQQMEHDRIKFFDFKLQDLTDYSQTNLLTAELQIARYIGDLKPVLDVQDRLQKVQDSLHEFQMDILTSTFQALHKVNTRALQSEITLKGSEVRILKQNKRLLFLSVFALIAIAILILLLYGFRMRNMKVVSQMENQLHEQNLKIAKKEREEAVLDLRHREQDMENLSIQFAYISNHQENLNKTLRDKLLAQNLDSNVIDDILGQDILRADLEHRFSLLRDHITTINQSFFSKLEQACPELTPNESELCSYLMMGISTKDIAFMKNVAPDSIKKAKYRLRKKLKADPSTDLGSYIKSLV